jgi:hypothetical protein
LISSKKTTTIILKNFDTSLLTNQSIKQFNQEENSMPVIGINVKAEIPCPPERVFLLASQGKPDVEIAKELGMCLTTFRIKKNNHQSIRTAYINGRKIAAELRESFVKLTGRGIRKSAWNDTDPESPPIQILDAKVFEAVKNGARRFKEIKQACGLDDRQIVKGLERLEQRLFVTRISGLIWDEWTAD